MGGGDFKNQNSHPNRVFTPSLSLIPLKMWPQPMYPQNIAPLPRGVLLGRELRGFDSRDLNSHPNGVYTPSLSLIALKMWSQPTKPQNIVPLLQGFPPGRELGGFDFQRFKFKPKWGLHNKFELNSFINVAITYIPPKYSPPPPGGPPRGWGSLGDLTSKIKIRTQIGFTHQV